jgi:hypothetical protein
MYIYHSHDIGRGVLDDYPYTCRSDDPRKHLAVA